MPARQALRRLVRTSDVRREGALCALRLKGPSCASRGGRAERNVEREREEGWEKSRGGWSGCEGCVLRVSGGGGDRGEGKIEEEMGGDRRGREGWRQMAGERKGGGKRRMAMEQGDG